MMPWQSPYLNNIVLACEVKPDSTKVEGDGGKLWDLGTLNEVLQKKRNGEGKQVLPALLKCLGWIPNALEYSFHWAVRYLEPPGERPC